MLGFLRSAKAIKMKQCWAWEEILVGRHLDRAGVASRDRQTISASWDRCRDDYGLDQWRQRHETAVRRERVPDAIETLGPLFSACRSQVEHIFQNIVGSGHAVILTDRSGTIIEFAVQSALEDLFRQAGLRRGADWSENHEGTNGIGTAILEKKSLTVYRDQHFHTDHASLTCTGAPVFDVQGDVLALFDVSSIGRSDDPEILAHTRALLEMSARLITRRNFQDHFANHWILRFHKDAERIGLLEEGLLALDQAGRVVGADEQAIAHLSAKDRSAIVGSDIGNLFEVEPGQLADRLAEECRAPTQLRINPDLASSHQHLHASLVGPKADRREMGTFVSRPKRQVTKAPATTGAERSGDLKRLVGRDERLGELAEKARKLLEHDVPLLIAGETGVGKDSFARALHQSSSRAKAPFIAVNCGALPENLIEGELFGYKAGAFTGAQANGFKGQILAANGGTLLLDEIGDMPLSAQTRLLQVLEQRKVTPLGSTVGVDLDIRLLAATHQPLDDLCRQGRFREDLFYRVCGFTVALPPLRDRNDIGYLVGRLLKERSFHNPDHFTEHAKAMIQSYSWPGNIRQLKHVLKTADILAEDNPIDAPHLQMIASGALQTSTKQVSAKSPDVPAPLMATPLDFSDHEKRVIEDALIAAKWNVSHCASALRLSRNTLYRKMKQHNIRRMG